MGLYCLGQIHATPTRQGRGQRPVARQHIRKLRHGQGQNPAPRALVELKPVHGHRWDADHLTGVQGVAVPVQLHMPAAGFDQEQLMQVRVAMHRNRPVMRRRTVHDPFHVQNIGKGAGLSIEVKVRNMPVR